MRYADSDRDKQLRSSEPKAILACSCYDRVGVDGGALQVRPKLLQRWMQAQIQVRIAIAQALSFRSSLSQPRRTELNPASRANLRAYTTTYRRRVEMEID